MTAMTLFASTFVLVFALGFQSLNVNNGHYWAAALTSLAIGASQMILFKLAPDASTLEIAGFISGGPFGIVASMWVHRRTLGRKPRDDERIGITDHGRALLDAYESDYHADGKARPPKPWPPAP